MAQLQLSLTLADELHELLLTRGEPLHFLNAARRLLALKEAPTALCREVIEALVVHDGRFCWHSPEALALSEWADLDPDIKDVCFVVVDVETTGGRPGPAKMTEIAAVRVEGLNIVSEFHTLVNPQRPIPPKIIEITGITPDMVRHAPRIEEVLPSLLDFTREAVFVGHNVRFDLSFLNYELSRLYGRRLSGKALDTLRMARLLAPGLQDHRLATVAAALGAPEDRFHRALPDARATAHVFLALVGRLQEKGVTRLSQALTLTEPEHRRHRHKISLTDGMPRSPGTYLFRDEQDNVLYIGKADRLRDRVRSYFVIGPDQSRRMRQAMARLHRIDWVETLTPLQAVVQETLLIQTHRPPCNTYGADPAKYVYLKVQGKNALRLQVSSTATARGAEVVIGPFRRKARVAAAVELLQRLYPIRRCARPDRDGCLYRQTGACSAPCTGDMEDCQRHDRLVLALVSWLAGHDMDAAETLAPDVAARRSLEQLARQRRFEEASYVRTCLEHALAVRRTSQALREAVHTNVAVVSTGTTSTGSREARVDIVWEGRLVDTVAGTVGTAWLHIARVIRGLPPLRSQPRFLAAAKEELDVLLAVRRWLKGHPAATLVPFPGPSGDHVRALESWSREVIAAAQRALESESKAAFSSL